MCVLFWGIQWNDWVHSRAWVVLFWGTPWYDWVLRGARVMCVFCGAQHGAWVTRVVWGYTTERMNTGSKVSVMKSAGDIECECVCVHVTHTRTYLHTHTCRHQPSTEKKAYEWVRNLIYCKDVTFFKSDVCEFDWMLLTSWLEQL